MPLSQLTGHKIFLNLNIGRLPRQERTLAIGWRTSIRLWVVNQSTLVHKLLTGHPMMGYLLKTLNGRPVMANHRRLLLMTVIPTSAIQVMVWLLEQYLIKKSKPRTGNYPLTISMTVLPILSATANTRE